jgi:hypothetical protein
MIGTMIESVVIADAGSTMNDQLAAREIEICLRRGRDGREGSVAESVAESAASAIAEPGIARGVHLLRARGSRPPT